MVQNWNLIYYAGEADHVFLSIGETGDLTDDFRDWDDACAIFDG